MRVLGDEVIELLKQGKTPKEIREALACAGNSVRYWADKLRMPLFKRGTGGKGLTEETKARVELAQRLKIAGYSYAAIGEHIGVSRQRAQQYLRIRLPKDRNQHRCEHCFKSAKVLHCHHVSYDTNEFMLLCVSCHSLAHVKPRRKRGEPMRTTGELHEFLSRAGRKGMANRWKGTTKAERRQAVQAAIDASVAKRRLRSLTKAQAAKLGIKGIGVRVIE